MHRFERCQSTESIWEEPEHGTFFGTTLRSTQQPMRRISWAGSLCLPLPVDNETALGPHIYQKGPPNRSAVGHAGVGGSNRGGVDHTGVDGSCRGGV